MDNIIASGIQPIQIESPLVQAGRALELKGAAQRNQLAQMQMAEMQRATEQKNRMRSLLSGSDVDMPQVNKLLEQAYIQEGDIAGLMEHRKRVNEAEAAQARITESKAKTAKAEQETKAAAFKLDNDMIYHAWESVVKSTTPEAYKASINDALAKKHITQEQANRGLAELAKAEAADRLTGTNAAFQKLRTDSMVSLLPLKDQVDRNAPKPEWKDLRGKLVRIESNPNAPGFDPNLKELAMTATIGEQETRRHNLKSELQAERRLKLDQQKAEREADPVFRQKMAQAEKMGQDIAKNDVAALAELPKVISRADETINIIDQMIGKQEVRDKKGKVIQPGTTPHPGFESAVGASMVPGSRLVPGTEAANFQALFDQAKGAAFLEAFNTLRGGGAISNVEGEKATAALNRMSLAQSEEEFVKAGREVQEIVRKGVENAKKKAKGINPAAASGGDAAKLEELLKKY